MSTLTKSDFWDTPNLKNDNAKVNDLCDIDPMEIVPSSFVLLLLVKILPLIAAGIYNRRPAARKHTDVSSMACKFAVCKILCPNRSRLPKAKESLMVFWNGWCWDEFPQIVI